MMDYLTMSSGSDTLSGSVGCGGSRQSRVRTVRLVRPNTNTLPPPGLTCRHGPGLGFSLRGGREHGTGFFVSNVELGSEAHRQGLKIGDQIIRVNGFTVEDAVHKEVLQLISNHTHLTLKVRSVGMIPVKDKSTDPLSWQIIPDYGHMISESPPLEEKNHDIRINIAVAQRAKLGCGICKGPEWKPGIFIQFTKEGGIARDAGLRPGDQILYCNNIDFTDISFNEAVNVMKTSRHLELLVRKGAGSELFPGESSGYNSSASSVTGDQSPSWSESKRLSIVKEESLELEDRLSQLDFRFKPKTWEKITYDWDESPRHFKPTIINLSENGTTIKNNGTAEECQNLETTKYDIEPPSPPPKPSKTQEVTTQINQQINQQISQQISQQQISQQQISQQQISQQFNQQINQQLNQQVNQQLNQQINQQLNHQINHQMSHHPNSQHQGSQQQISLQQIETKTVVVEVHRSDIEDNHEKMSEVLKKSPSTGSFTSLASRSSTATSTSLSSAITLELQRRSEKKKENDRQINIEEELQKNKILKGVDTEKKHQHDKLMDEFKKAHRRMFNTTVNEEIKQEDTTQNRESNNNIKSELEAMIADRLANSQKLNDRRCSTTSEEVQKSVPTPPCVPSPAVLANRRHTIDAGTTAPPPPPPMPPLETSMSSKTLPKPSTKPKAPPVPQKIHHPSPPPCPTPDYDTLSINSISSNNTLPRQTSKQQLNGLYSRLNYNDEVDMESLESFKLNNPASTRPKPPSTYFNRPKSTPSSANSSQNSTLTKKSRPVSVTIGEYPSGANRRLPSKFDFLNNTNETDGYDPENQPITSRLASELAQTLSRSNLRKRTESENMLGDSSVKPQTNGTVTISVNNTNNVKAALSPIYLNNNPHKLLMKSQSNDVMMNRNIENISNMLANRVTIKIADTQDRKNDTPNGILKNGNGNQCSTQHKPLVHQKSITFGEITTVINDRPMHVT